MVKYNTWLSRMFNLMGKAIANDGNHVKTIMSDKDIKSLQENTQRHVKVCCGKGGMFNGYGLIKITADIFIERDQYSRAVRVAMACPHCGATLYDGYGEQMEMGGI